MSVEVTKSANANLMWREKLASGAEGWGGKGP